MCSALSRSALTPIIALTFTLLSPSFLTPSLHAMRPSNVACSSARQHHKHASIPSSTPSPLRTFTLSTLHTCLSLATPNQPFRCQFNSLRKHTLNFTSAPAKLQSLRTTNTIQPSQLCTPRSRVDHRSQRSSYGSSHLNTQQQRRQPLPIRRLSSSSHHGHSNDNMTCHWRASRSVLSSALTAWLRAAEARANEDDARQRRGLTRP